MTGVAEVVPIVFGGLSDGDPDAHRERRLSSRRLWRSIACCMATAQARARLRLVKATMSPSPRFLTSVPPAAWMAAPAAARSGSGEGRQPHRG